MSKASRISVSIAREDLAWAEKTARARRTSLSQVVSTALRHEKQMEARNRVLRPLAKIVPGDTRGRRAGMGIGRTFDTEALLALEMSLHAEVRRLKHWVSWSQTRTSP